MAYILTINASGAFRNLRLSCVALLLCSGVATAQSVHYGGLAYLGSFEFIAANYPLTRSLNADESQLDRALLDALKAAEPESLQLRYDLANLNAGNPLVLAVAVERERVSREVFDFEGQERTKVIVEISLQILLFDLAESVFMDSIPVSVAINDVLPGNVADIDQHVLSLAQRLYFGNDMQSGLIAQVTNAISAYAQKPRDALRFQLDQIDIHERTLALVPTAVTQAQVAQQLGQAFSARLALRAGVSVIPYTRGYALGNQLPGRFINGEAFNLRLPEPDYAFAVEIKNLVKSPQDSNLVFGAQMHFQMTEPFTKTVAISGDFRQGIYKLADESRVLEDDWSAYEDAIQSLLDALIDQLKSPEKSWHTQHARDKNSFRQFAEHKELFDD